MKTVYKSFLLIEIHFFVKLAHSMKNKGKRLYSGKLVEFVYWKWLLIISKMLTETFYWLSVLHCFGPNSFFHFFFLFAFTFHQYLCYYFFCIFRIDFGTTKWRIETYVENENIWHLIWQYIIINTEVKYKYIHQSIPGRLFSSRTTWLLRT